MKKIVKMLRLSIPLAILLGLTLVMSGCTESSTETPDVGTII